MIEFIYMVYLTDGYDDIETYYTGDFRVALDIKRRLKYRYSEYHYNRDCFQIQKLRLSTTGELIEDIYKN